MVHVFLSEICISEGTQLRATKRADQFRRLLLHRKQAHLNIIAHFPSPSNQSIDKILLTSGRALGRDVRAAAGLPPSSPCRGCRTATELPLPGLPDCRRAPPVVADSYSGGSSAAVRQHSTAGLQRVKAKVPFPHFFSTMAEITPTMSLLVVEVPETSEAVFMIHNII